MRSTAASAARTLTALSLSLRASSSRFETEPRAGGARRREAQVALVEEELAEVSAYAVESSFNGIRRTPCARRRLAAAEPRSATKSAL